MPLTPLTGESSSKNKNTELLTTLVATTNTRLRAIKVNVEKLSSKVFHLTSSQTIMSDTLIEYNKSLAGVTEMVGTC